MRASKRGRNQVPDRQQPHAPDRNLRRDGEGNRLVGVSIEKQLWAGPLPAPETLQQFEDIVPGLARAIANEWHEETAHRRRFDNTALKLEIWERLGSRVLAFLFSVLCLVTAVICAYLGAPVAAAILGGGTIAAVVAALVYRGQSD